MTNIGSYIETEEKVNTLSYLRERTQKILDRKSEYIKTAISTILPVEDCNNPFKVSVAYREVVEQNNKLMDLLRDTKDIFILLIAKNKNQTMNIAKEKIDFSTQLGQQQLKQVEGLIKILTTISKVLEIEQAKMDRFVRFYEKTFNYYNTF